MAILDLKSNLSQWRKPTTVESGEKKKLSESPVKAVYNTSNELKPPTDIKINKVDNSTSIQVPGAKKIDYKLFSINAKRNRGIPAISKFFGSSILDKESLFKKFIPGNIVKVSEYKEQRVKEINKVSEFVRITPRGIQHISTIEILKTILKDKLSLYKDQLPINILKLSLYKDQLPIDILKLSLYKDQLPAIIDKLSLYKDQIPNILGKLSLYKDQRPNILDKLSLYRKLAVNGFDDLQSGARGFTLYQTATQYLGLDTNALKYTYPKTVKFGRLKDRLAFTGQGLTGFNDLESGAIGFTRYQTVTQYLGISGNTYIYPNTVRGGRLVDRTQIDGALRWPLRVTFRNGDLGNTTYNRTVYTSTKPYTSTTGITGDTLEKYFKTAGTDGSARDIEYKKFNLRDSSFNTGNFAIFDSPLILTGIQRKDFVKTGFYPWETWKFDDGFIRGGVVTSTQRAIVDTLRIGKWMASVKGLLFLTRQVGLQLSNPNSEQRGTLKQEILVGNGLVSTLANTLAQHAGLRFRKDSIPFVKRSTYSVAVAINNFDSRYNPKTYLNPIGNRLLKLTNEYFKFPKTGVGTPSYVLSTLNGGAQSVYGIGPTLIKRTVQSNISNYDDTLQRYYTYTYAELQSRANSSNINSIKIKNFLLKENGTALDLVGTDTANIKWISTQGAFEKTVIQDYTKTSQHIRTKLRVPDYGKRGKDLRNPLKGDFMKVYKKDSGMIDPIWKVNQATEEEIDDFIKLMFEDLQTREKFRFRAYIENVSEDFSPNWQEVKILGRADSPYIYQGFERNLSVSFKAAALSRGDLMLMWDQLERLARTTVPSYKSGYKMVGPLIKFTLGDWFIATPAYIKSLSYTVDNETPWEINLEDSEINSQDINAVGKMPMYVTIQANLQIFGEIRPEDTTEDRQLPKTVRYNTGNLYPLGQTGLRNKRQKRFATNTNVV